MFFSLFEAFARWTYSISNYVCIKAEKWMTTTWAQYNRIWYYQIKTYYCLVEKYLRLKFVKKNEEFILFSAILRTDFLVCSLWVFFVSLHIQIISIATNKWKRKTAHFVLRIGNYAIQKPSSLLNRLHYAWAHLWIQNSNMAKIHMNERLRILTSIFSLWEYS